jgi:hypothetical protein
MKRKLMNPLNFSLIFALTLVMLPTTGLASGEDTAAQEEPPVGMMRLGGFNLVPIYAEDLKPNFGMVMPYDKPVPSATGEEPIGAMRLGHGRVKSVYASELTPDFGDTTGTPHYLSSVAESFPIDPDAPVEARRRLYAGAIPVGMHLADIRRLREPLTQCLNMDASPDCKAHCQSTLALLDQLQHTGGIFTSATHRLYYANAEREHQAMVAAMEQRIAECPMVMQ